MKPLQDTLKEYKIEKKGANSERADLIGQLQQGVNDDRKGTKYKPLSARVIAIKVGHLRTADLYHLLKICNNGDSFSKVFFGSLKVKVK